MHSCVSRGKESLSDPALQVKPEQEALISVWLGDGRKRGTIPWSRLGQQLGNQVVNYVRGSTCLTLKTELVRTLGSDVDYVPRSYLVYPKPTASATPDENNENGSRRERFMHRRPIEDDRDELLADAANSAAVWILKPSHSGKGVGITISEDVRTLLKDIDSCEKRWGFVIQKYVQAPLLLPGGRKFDIRTWVLLCPDGRAQMFSEGVLRTGSVPYVEGSYDDDIIHLTNHCVQERSSSFGQHEPGNELSFQQFDEFLRESRGVSLRETILPQIKKIVKETVEKAWPSVEPLPGSKILSTQLFGYDFMVDDSLKVWLLEVNGSPACREALLPDLAQALLHDGLHKPMDLPVPDKDVNRPHFEQL